MVCLLRIWHQGGHGNAIQGCIPGAGLGDAAFREAFGTGEQCPNAPARLRRRDGFIRPGCNHRGHCRPTRRSLYRCNRCRKQTSLTADTIPHSIRLPLTVWFTELRPNHSNTLSEISGLRVSTDDFRFGGSAYSSVRRSSRNSEAGFTPVTRRRSRARVQAT